MAVRFRTIAFAATGVFALAVASVAIFIVLRVLPAANPPQHEADFGDSANWVCLPGRNDSCAANIDATAIAADGTTTRIAPVRPADPPVDCFYVYPTVSLDRTANARLAMAPEVDFVTRAQFARFGTVCRTYAPLYRQRTLRWLFASSLGLGERGDAGLAYRDVRDAWRTYLARYNHGRGVVLIGHSQGSRVLKRLVQEEIEGKPAQSRLVSVILAGNEVLVPAGQDSGGDFYGLKLCRAPDQVGCVISFSSFRADAPPPPDSRYGRGPGHGVDAACTNPAALGGGKVVLDSYFSTRRSAARPYTDPPVAIDTPFVSLPGLISGACVHDAHGTYLAISLNGNPADRRIDRIYGDVVVFGRVLPQWGLHVIDMDLVQGDLVNLVRTQAAAYLAKGH